jgi:triosephosphate isomerase
VQSQLEDALQNVSDQAFDQVVIAYEPIWAIGTGKTASSDQAQEMHAFIRNWLSKRYGDVSAAACRILYGGSCKPSNADELFAQPDVNGGLIGGASLNAEDFLAIVRAAEAQD